MKSDKEIIGEKISEWYGKQIYLYGAGNMGYIAFKLLKYYGIHVTAYVTSTQNGYCNGIPVFSVDELEVKNLENCIIILTLNRSYHYEIKQLLMNQGFSNIDDSFFELQISFFREIYRDYFRNKEIDITRDIIES